MAELELSSGTNSGRRYALSTRAVLGRHPDCDIVLEEGAVSRHHAVVTRDEAGYFLEDLKSRNGTFLNSQPIDGRARLEDGDEIQICETHFIFRGDSRNGRSREDSTRLTDALFMDDEGTSSTSTIVSKLDVSSSHSGVRLTVNPQVKLEALLEISNNLTKAISLDDVLPKVLDSLFKVFVQADRGFVVLRERPNGMLVPKATKHRRDDIDETIRISRTIVNQVIESKQAILSADAATDSRFQLSQSISDFRIRSMMCAPLINSDGDVLGVIQIDTLDQRSRFRADDLDVLASVATQAAFALENAQLHDAALRQKAIERDLDLARQVQKGLLPLAAPRIKGYEFFDYYEPANQVGGDYFDYVPLPGNKVAVVLADVSGKGVAAALVMAKLSGEVRYCLASERTPAAAVRRLNSGFGRKGWEDRFVTMILLVLDYKSHQVCVVNAGHMPPVLRNAQGEICDVAENVAGIPLGVSEDFEYEQVVLPFQPGDLLVCYTDGFSEAMNASGELFGLPRIRDQLRQGASQTSDIGHRLLDNVKQFLGGRPQNDDMCLACVGRVPA
jgi:serine phosphatase RsbU (regulator of sigma subunit)